MSEKVFDLGQLEALAGGSNEFVEGMIEAFLEHTPQQLNEMNEAYIRKDIPTMGAIAHKIKPNIDLFGILSIKNEIRELEHKGKAGVDDAAIQENMDKVKMTLEKAFSQLREYREKL